jgi:hypothetical protein
MPLPKPHKKTETQSEFVSRCMSNTHIQNDFDTQEQKLAVCFSLWKHKKKKAAKSGYIVSTPEEEYIITPEDEEKEKNPLDDKDSDTSTNPPIPPKSVDKLPPEAPRALDDSNTPQTSTKGSEFIKKIDPKLVPSLHSGGLNPNPDNPKNFHIRPDGNWEHPSIDDMKWLLCNENGIPQDYMDPNPDINKLKEYYIGEIDSMPEDQLKSDWPSTFQKIEKEFDRPGKVNTPENILKDKQSKENRDADKIAEKDKPFVM